MHVLVGVCDTDNSFEALEATIERAREADDQVTVAVLDDPTADLSVAELRDRVRSVVTEVEVPTQIQDVDGDPAAKMVEMAEANGYDQLVLGECGRTPMGKIQIDEIAQFILFNAEVTVKLVR